VRGTIARASQLTGASGHYEGARSEGSQHRFHKVLVAADGLDNLLVSKNISFACATHSLQLKEPIACRAIFLIAILRI
jgi:hypothetical protein